MTDASGKLDTLQASFSFLLLFKLWEYLYHADTKTRPLIMCSEAAWEPGSQLLFKYITRRPEMERLSPGAGWVSDDHQPSHPQRLMNANRADLP